MEPSLTKVYPVYWEFVHKRMGIFMRRFRQEPAPWTDDPILQQYRFTNVFRASDRVSQYLIRNVIYKAQDADEDGDVLYGLTDTVYRTLLFKMFNLPETWEYLSSKVGQICWYDGCTADYIKIIMELREAKKRQYNNAYMMQGRKMPQYGFESGYKFENHLLALGWMMEHGLVDNLQACNSLAQMYQDIIAYPYMGKFLAYQYAIDLCYSPYFNFSEDDFVMAGPGAERGLRKIFADAKPSVYEDMLHWLVENQMAEQYKLGLIPVALFGRKLHLIDIQNVCCEVDKYTRVSLPDADNFGYKRIKQVYKQPDLRPIEYFFPPKWGINGNVSIGHDNLHPQTETQVASAA